MRCAGCIRSTPARMGAQAAEQIATRFRHADMVDRYEALFESLAMGTAGRRPARFHPDSGRFRALGGADSRALLVNGSWLPAESASKAERRSLYTQAYDELFRRIPDHPQITIKVSPESARHEVGLQLASSGGSYVQGRPSWRLGRAIARSRSRSADTPRVCCG